MTYTVTVCMTVYTDSKETAINNAQKQLEDICDGSDFTGIRVMDAVRDADTFDSLRLQPDKI